MALKGNKGEWSEIYTLFKLLGEGQVSAGDQNLNKIQDLFYPIVMILRQEKEGAFNYLLEDKNVVIQTPDGEILLSVPASVFLSEAEILLKAINEGGSANKTDENEGKKNNSAFAIPQIEEFMNNIYCHSLKAKSSDKTDIRIVLHDRRTKINSEMKMAATLAIASLVGEEELTPDYVIPSPFDKRVAQAVADAVAAAALRTGEVRE